MRLLLRFCGLLFAAGTIVFVVGIAAAAGLLWHYSKALPDYSQLQDYEPAVMTRVHASDGSLLAEYARERRLYLPIQAVPKLVTNAFVAAEDKNFYEHGGIDFSGKISFEGEPGPLELVYPEIKREGFLFWPGFRPQYGWDRSQNGRAAACDQFCQVDNTERTLATQVEKSVTTAVRWQSDEMIDCPSDVMQCYEIPPMQPGRTQLHSAGLHRLPAEVVHEERPAVDIGMGRGAKPVRKTDHDSCQRSPVMGS